MIEALKPRSEIDASFQWDLNTIFTDDTQWEAHLKAATEAVKRIPELKGTLGQNEQSLKAALDQITQTYQAAELVYLYAHLKLDEDNGNSKHQAMRDRAQRMLVELETAASFLTPELLEIPEVEFEKFLQFEGLKTYRHMLKDVARSREHTLDSDQERLLAMLGDAASGPSNSFNMMESVDMTFPNIKDEDGNEVELTHGNFSIFRESEDANVRREAFIKYFGEFEKYKNLFVAIYSNSVKFDLFYSDARNFIDATESALFDNNVPVAVYDNLIEAVHSRLYVMEEYLALRKRVLKLDELHLYDLYVPLIKGGKLRLDFEQSKALVKTALAPLGQEYAQMLNEAYDNRWLDVYENKGKTTGAFSCGVYGVHPFVLLNYQGKLDDAFTLAHELGHAMHSYKSDKAQDYANHDYSILVAEVASTVNEVLLIKHMLKNETDQQKKAYLLNHFLEGFRTTLFRQVLFAEFEQKAHRMAQSGEPLTADTLSALYKSLNEKYYKGAVTDDFMAIEWARIPHFYRAFYVYQYATGYSSAVAIANKILNTNDASGYLDFLSSGGSDYPLELLKRAGVDLTTPEPVQLALDMFETTVKELKELLEG